MFASGFPHSFLSKVLAQYDMCERKSPETFSYVCDGKQFIDFLMRVVRSSYLQMLALSIHRASLLCTLNHYCISPFCSKTEILKPINPGSPKAEETEAMGCLLSSRVNENILDQQAMSHKYWLSRYSLLL